LKRGQKDHSCGDYAVLEMKDCFFHCLRRGMVVKRATSLKSPLFPTLDLSSLVAFRTIPLHVTSMIILNLVHPLRLWRLKAGLEEGSVRGVPLPRSRHESILSQRCPICPEFGSTRIASLICTAAAAQGAVDAGHVLGVAHVSDLPLRHRERAADRETLLLVKLHAYGG
jgi:hypothetical protein